MNVMLAMAAAPSKNTSCDDASKHSSATKYTSIVEHTTSLLQALPPVIILVCKCWSCLHSNSKILLEERGTEDKYETNMRPSKNFCGDLSEIRTI